MTTKERELDPSTVATLGRDELLFASIRGFFVSFCFELSPRSYLRSGISYLLLVACVVVLRKIGRG
jgi:hypothetical protein